MAKKDSSDTMKNFEQLCKAIVMSKEEKEKLWKLYFTKDNSLSLRQMEYSWMGFNHSEADEEEMKPFHDRFFAEIKDIF